MTIELYINGMFFNKWSYEDVREDWSELGMRKYKSRIDILINQIKEYVYEQLEYNEYEFFVVYQSELNLMNVTDFDLHQFNKKLDMARVDKIVAKYRNQKAS